MLLSLGGFLERATMMIPPLSLSKRYSEVGYEDVSYPNYSYMNTSYRVTIRTTTLSIETQIILTDPFFTGDGCNLWGHMP